ncbi:MAG: fibronectin type III domain-containing protein [Opitutaceae bacterium]|nr:fibronectin type III domain-containing protein [Opitutaceae bacterium]
MNFHLRVASSWLSLLGYFLLAVATSHAQSTPTSGAIAAGTSHSLGLRADGTVWAWGLNTNGQLGDSSTTNREAPVAVSALTGVAAVSAGASHSLALKTDGTVRAWGLNTNGRLGDGTTTQRTSPVAVSTITGITAVAAGGSHSLALKSDGTVWAWGLNTNGQLGDGSTTQRTSPVQIASFTGVIAIAAGTSHSLALKSDGTVWAWGLNTNGRLGDGTTTQRTSPVQVSTITSITAIAAGGSHSMALKSDGTVWNWGLNSNGQLGDGTTTQRTSPVQIGSFGSVASIGAGNTHSLAVKSDGTTWSWGLNSNSQLGDGTTTQRTAPVQVPSLTIGLKVAAGGTHSLVLTTSGTVVALGNDASGQLGDGVATNLRPKLIQSGTFIDVLKVAAGTSHTVALREGGTVWTWGLNTNGQLGDGSTTLRVLPVQVTTLTTVTAVAAGASHSLAAKADGTAWAWGLNTNGQLGDNSTTQRTSPVQVSTLTGTTAVAAGGSHSLALKSDGTVRSWGLNTNGQLGDASTTQRLVPVSVATLTGITAVAAGGSHSLALKSDGTVWSWGLNTNGQLGDASTTQRTSPVQVSTVTGIVAISAGTSHSMALKSDGTVWVWGLNTNGRLGDGTTTQRNSPVQLASFTGVSGIAAGGSHTLAVKTDGTARGWGLNTSGQIGDGTFTQRTSPVSVSVLTGANAVAAGGTHSLAVLTNKTLRVWGNHASGQLGAPTIFRSASAIALKSTAADTDLDGLPDTWETSSFGNLSQSGSADTDGDGLTHVQEYVRGTNPTLPDVDGDFLTDPVDSYPADYFNNTAPTLTIVGGNNQTTPAGQFNPVPFDVAVWNTAGTVPLINAPITFDVISGGGNLATTNVGSPPLVSTLPLVTDQDGTAQAFYKQPATSGVTSSVRATAGVTQILLSSSSSSADQSPPSTPTNLSASSITVTSLLLSWTASTDNVAVTSYDVYRDGVLAGTTATPSISLSSLSPATTYAWSVKAKDAANNVSTASAVLLATTLSDTAAPSVPSGLASSSIGLTSFTLTWTASTDNVSVSGYDIFKNGVLVGTSSTPSLAVSGLLPGTAYTMTVKSRDAVPNASSASSGLLVTTTADTTAPSVPTGLAQTAATPTTLTLSWTASTDNLAVASYEIFRDGVLAGTVSGTSMVITGLKSATRYAMTVKARDTVGNLSAASSTLAALTALEGPPLSTPGLKLWLQASTLAPGTLTSWTDQSGLGNHATQTNASWKPDVMTGQLNGRSAVRFDGTNDSLNVPNILGSATAGEAFVVLKTSGLAPAVNHGFWRMGTEFWGAAYTLSNGWVLDEFGSDTRREIKVLPVAATSYHLYNVSSQAGEWVARFNGLVGYSDQVNTVGFRSDPSLGRSEADYFTGDMTEVVIFNRVLTPDERQSIGEYLTQKYALPTVPIPAKPSVRIYPVSGTQVDLGWSHSVTTAGVLALIERKTPTSEYQSVAQARDLLSWTDTSLTPGATYSYRIKLRTYAGDSEWSDPVTITTPVSIQSPPSDGLKLWVRPTVGAAAEGALSLWKDQSGLNNHLIQNDANHDPTLVNNQLNGFPIVRFAGSDFLYVPNLLGGSTAGEIFAVLKRAPIAPDTFNTLWSFGFGYGSGYYNSDFYEDFGTNEVNFHAGSAVVDQFHVRNVVMSAGVLQERLNGFLHWERSGATVDFRTNPDIGAGFHGDIAEVLIYNRALSAVERESVGIYLANRYSLSTIPIPAKPVLSVFPNSATHVDLAWTSTATTAGTVSTIERMTGTGGFVAVADVVDTLAWSDTTLSAGTNYTYRVTVRTYGGKSSTSDPVAVTTSTTVASPPKSGMRLWLRSTVGTQSAGPLTVWYDQSGLNNHFFQTNAAYRATTVFDQVGGRPVVRFAGETSLNGPDLMAGTSAGEIIAVLKKSPVAPDTFNSIWQFGTGFGSGYYNADAYEDFGASESTFHVGSTLADSFHVRSVSAGDGELAEFLNGIQTWQRTGVTPAFRNDPSIGGGFHGDIAELLIYSRRLTPTEREQIGTYLATKYPISSIPVPAAPVLTASPVAGDRVDLSWTGLVTTATTTALIERKVGSGDFALVSQLSNQSSWSDSGLVSGTTYTYRVRLRTYTGVSPYSNALSVTTSASLLSPPGSGLRLWLRPTVGTQGAGPLSSWSDQSGRNNPIVQDNPDFRPTLVTGQLGGLPVVRFDGIDDVLPLPDVMAGATSGEILAVVKKGTVPADTFNTLWGFGFGYGSGYYNADAYEDFGTNEVNFHVGSSVSNNYHIHNVSIAANGDLAVRLNGTILWQRTGAAVTFRTDPTLGGGFNGDLVEILIYDRVLSSAERSAIQDYLNGRYITSDSVAPSTPGGLAVSSQSASSFTLSWTASTDNVGVVAYDVFKDGSFHASSTGSPLVIAGLVPSTSYSMTVKARDAAGNVSSPSSATPGTTTADTLTPSVPQALTEAFVGSTEATVRWSPSTDNVGVTGYEVYQDGVLLGTSATPARTFTGLSPGSVYVITVRARDAAGNVSNPSTPFNLRPVVDIVPPSTPTGLSTASISGTSFSLSWTSSNDNVGVVGYEVLTGGNLVEQVPGNSIAVSGLVPGATYRMSVVAIDSAGNRSAASGLVEVTTSADTTVPSTPASVAVSAISRVGATVSWAASTDNVAVTGYEVYRDATLAGSATTPSFELTGLNSGTSYAITVKAIDSSGNRSLASSAVVCTTLIDGVPASLPGLRLWLRGSTLAPGSITEWVDQSGKGMNATQATSGFRPSAVASQINGHTVVRFDGGDDRLNLSNVMLGTQAGEIYAVLRKGTVPPNSFSLPWSFGLGYGTGYYNADALEDFGTTDVNFHPDSPVSNNYHLHNTSTAAGSIIKRLNGLIIWQRTGAPIAFSDAPILGQAFAGDIAELMVFDRVLSANERETLGSYLTQRYALTDVLVPAAPQLQIAGVAANHVDLWWNPPAGTSGTVTTIERKVGAGSFTVVGEIENASAWSDLTTSAGTAYTYRIRTRTYAGTSSFSNEAINTPDAVAAPTSTGRRLWLRSTAGTRGVGPIAAWQDQSGLGNDAIQSTPGMRPTLVAAQVGGQPVIRFDGIDDRLVLPSVMAGSTAGEIIALVKKATVPLNTFNTLWDFGLGTGYYNSDRYEGFGTTETNFHPDSPISQDYHLQSTSLSATGDLIVRLNGAVHWQRSGAAVSFRSDPTLGAGFKGDIVELLVYDRVLSPSERDAAHLYLTSRYSGVDAVVPSTPTGLAASAIGASSFTLSWNASTDNVSVLDYEVLKDGIPYGVATTPSLAISGLSPSTGYSMTVRARDSARNLSSLSSPLVVTTTGDTTAPSAPTGLLESAIGPSSFILSWTAATDNVAVTGYEVFRDGASIGTTTNLTLPITGLATGTAYSMTVKARDAANNVSASSAAKLVTTTSDTTPPSVPGGLASSSITLTSFTLSWSASSDNVAVAGYEVYRDGTLVGQTASLSLSLSGLVPGTAYSMTVKAKDTSQNLSTASTALGVSTTGDSVAPSVPSALAASSVTRTSLNLSWTGSTDNVGVSGYDIYKDGVLLTSATSTTHAITGLLANTSYSFTIRARDAAGNTSAASTALVVLTNLDGPPAALSGLRLWLRADTTATGAVATWKDQSGLGHHANQGSGTSQPLSVSNVLNGKPVIRFDGTDDFYPLPNLLSGANAGEILAVVKKQSVPANTLNTLWHFGTNAYGTAYYNSNKIESFGTSDSDMHAASVAANDFHILGVSIGGGTTTERHNGVVTWSRTGVTTAFSPTPQLGWIFKGDIAEVMVFNRVLSASERESIGNYLASRYALPGITAPSLPTVEAAVASASSVDVRWTQGALAIATVERQTNGGTFVPVAEVENAQSWTDTSVSAGVNYGYRVKVRNYLGTSAYSTVSTATISTQLPVIPDTGRRLWLRSTSGIDQTGMGSRWTDQSGSANHAVQSTLPKVPALLSNQLGGYPALGFAGGQVLVLPEYLRDASAGELFALMKFDVPGAVNPGPTAWKLNPTHTMYYESMYNEGGGVTTQRLRDSFGSTANRLSAPVQVPVTNYYLHNVAAASSHWSLRLNGLVHLQDAANTFVSAVGYLGAGGPNGGYFKGQMIELLSYDRMLTIAEREAVGTYFAVKYSIPSVSVPPKPVLSAPTVHYRGVTLTWTAPSNLHAVTTIERKQGAGAYQVVGEVTDSTSYRDLTVLDGQSYTYRVSSRSYAGVSPWSDELTLSTPALVSTGLKLWLRSDDLVPGAVTSWVDQSVNGNHATQATSTRRPLAVASAVNGYSAVRFDGIDDSLSLPNVLGGATAGEIIAVVKARPLPAPKFNRLWSFGSALGSSYWAGARYEDFGTNQDNLHPGSPLSTEYHIASVSIGAGLLSERVNGLLNWSRTGAAVAFRTDPQLGGSLTDLNTVFNGDLVEVFVYNRVLSQSERDSVSSYLAKKFAPASVQILKTPVLTTTVRSSTEIALQWTDVPLGNYALATIERSIGAGAFSSLVTLENASTHIDTGLSSNTEYRYRVKYWGLAGETAFSNVAIARTPSLPSVVSTQPGTAIVDSSGDWVSTPEGFLAQSVRGTLSYSLTAPTSGLYAFDVTVKDGVAINPQREFDIDVVLDGTMVGNLRIRASGTTSASGRVQLPWIAAGPHTLKLVWHNGRSGSFLQVVSVALVQPDTTDANSDGRPDWIDPYLSSTFVFDSVPAISHVSPFTVEGNSAHPAFVTLEAQHQTAPLSSITSTRARHGLARQFFGDVTLNALAPTVVTAVEAGGLRTASKQITWAAMNLKDSMGTSMVIRKDAALLVKMYDVAAPTVNYEITVERPGGASTTTGVASSQNLQIDFFITGEHKILVKPVGGTAELAATIVVRHTTLEPAPTLVSGFRSGIGMPLLGVPAEATIESDPSLVIREEVQKFPRYLAVDCTGPARMIARLGGPTGPIVDAIGIDLIRFYWEETSAVKAVHRFPDGTILYRSPISIEGTIPSDLAIHLTSLGGVVFLNGRTSMTITASDFDSMGRFSYYFYAGLGGTTCHTVEISTGSSYYQF